MPTTMTVDLNNEAEIVRAITILNFCLHGEVAGPAPLTGNVNQPEETLDDDMGMGEEDATDDLDSMLGDTEPEPPAAPSIDDMKAAFKVLVTKKGKDAAMELVKKALAKMGVAKIEMIPDEKRETFIKILTVTANK